MFFEKRFVEKATQNGCVTEGVCVDSRRGLGNDESGNS